MYVFATRMAGHPKLTRILDISVTCNPGCSIKATIPDGPTRSVHLCLPEVGFLPSSGGEGSPSSPPPPLPSAPPTPLAPHTPQQPERPAMPIQTPPSTTPASYYAQQQSQWQGTSSSCMQVQTPGQALQVGNDPSPTELMYAVIDNLSFCVMLQFV